MRRLYLRLRSLFLRARLEREMRDEMSRHIEQATARNVAGGMSPHDAARAARREFGNMDVIEQNARDARGWRWLDALRGDLRFALRHFRRTPLATVTMVLVLALGIGANVGLFTVFHSLRTMPGPGITRDPSLVRIRGTSLTPSSSRMNARPMAYGEMLTYSGMRELFASVASTTTGGRQNVSLVGQEETPQRARTVYVSENYFQLLDVRPALGTFPRVALESPAEGALVAVIDHELWQSVFGGAADVVGRTMRIGDVPVTIAAVTPRGFVGAADASADVVWLPYAAYPTVEKTGRLIFSSPDSARFVTIARIRPGVSTATATAAVKPVADAAMAARTVHGNREIGSVDVVTLSAFNESPHSDWEMKLVVGAVSIVTLLLLLVTCTNVSSLLVGMALARRREIAVRLSLGAARTRVITQLLTESLVLAIAAGMLALLIVKVFLVFLDRRVPDALIGEYFIVDWRATIAACGIAAFTTLIFGLSPALHATRLALADVLKDAGAAVSGSRSYLHRALVVAQITLTQPLLVALAVTTLIGYRELENLRPGPHDDRIVELSYGVSARPGQDMSDPKAELARIQERVSALPGVVAVSTDARSSAVRFMVHDADRVPNVAADTQVAHVQLIGMNYLAVHDVPVVRGRNFVAAEMDSTATPVIIGDRLARALFANTDPIGRRLDIIDHPAPPPRIIVGVVDDERTAHFRSRRREDNLIFLPQDRTTLAPTFLIRTTLPGDDMLASIRNAGHTTSLQLSLYRVSTIATINASNRREFMQIGGALAGGALLTLLLSAIGLYAVVAFAVNQRTREIGIRSALGARPRQVVGVFFQSGLRLSFLGLLLGLPISLAAVEMVPDARGGLPRLISVAAIVATGLLGVASLATWLPARRAATVDPLTALRSE